MVAVSDSAQASNWSHEEVEAVVADYFQMLTMELAGQAYNKSTHRRNLALKLNGRSGGSIEFKHCNISAVLIELGVPYIRGYQPRGNYQALLAQVVAGRLRQRGLIDQVAAAAVIEVKTTTFGRETPFFLSDRELVRSRVNQNDFHLYRVFEFRNQPRLFDLPGPLHAKCHLDPISYRARFA